MSPPPTPTPVAAAYRKDHYTVVTSTYPPLFPLLLEAPAQRARPYDRVRIQSLSASQEAAGQPLESLTQSSWYHSLSPTIGSSKGVSEIWHAEKWQYIHAVRPSEGAYVCWIRGETRADRRLIRALDHVRDYFKHRPYHCGETHVSQRTEPTSPLPLVSVWRVV